MFSLFMPLEQVIAMFGHIIPFIHTKLDVVLYNVVPFNLLKGLIIALATLPLYQKLARVVQAS